MKRSVLSSLATLVIACSSMAQHANWCETDRRLAEALASSPEFRQQYIEFQQEIRELMHHAAAQRDGEQEYIIPVVFHILHLQGEENISNEQVLNALAILNRDYAKQNADTATVHPAYQNRIAKMGIQFRLATKDPNGNCTNGIVRYQSTETLRGESTSKLRPWPRNRYMNVYIVRQILSGAAGYFTYGPWPVLDGIVLLQDYTGSNGSAAGIPFTGAEFRSRALTHEVGHYLSLAHVWGENNGVPSDNIPPGSCQMQALCGDDGVYDTPNTKGWSCCPQPPSNPTFPNRPWGDCDRQSFKAYHGRIIPPIPAEPVRYDFDLVTTGSGATDPSPAPAVRDSLDSTAVRIPLTPMQAVGVSANSSQNGAFAFSSWGLGATDGDNDYNNLTGSLDLGRYYQFFINPPVTHQINFRGVTFKAGRNGSGPRTFAVRSSRDNFSTNIALASSNSDVVIQPGNVAFFANDSATSSTVITVNPTGAIFPTQETPFTLRIYAFNSEDAPGAFSIDSLVVLGRSGTIENIENYMEYSYCSKMFTIGQGERARAALLSPTFERDNLWTEENLITTGVADGHQQTCAPVADFYAQVAFASGQPAVPFSPTTCVNQNVRFMDNSQRAQPTSWSWTFQDGNPASSDQRNPVVQFTSRGWKSVTLTVANDVGSSTVTKEYAVYVGQPNGEWGPYMENFETQQDDNLFPLMAMNYESNHTYWRRHVGGGYSGNGCARLNSGDRDPFNIIRPDNEGDYDELISPQLSLSGAPLSTLSFRWAYSTGTNVAANITERLVVDYSSDCGRTWNPLGVNNIITGTALVTNGNVDQMPPPPEQWRQRTFNLAGAMMGSSVRFRFRFISSAFSRDLFIDDIQFGSTAVGMAEWLSENFIHIFPNPANDHFTLQVFGMSREATEVTVTDMRGAVVYQNKFQPMGDALIELSARGMGLSDGMYLVQASNSQGRSAQKLAVGQ
ncbi:MAG: M43 family zinc metalloprotease [Flavobacteriales bacterium]